MVGNNKQKAGPGSSHYTATKSEGNSFSQTPARLIANHLFPWLVLPSIALPLLPCCRWEGFNSMHNYKKSSPQFLNHVRVYKSLVFRRRLRNPAPQFLNHVGVGKSFVRVGKSFLQRRPGNCSFAPRSHWEVAQGWRSQIHERSCAEATPLLHLQI